MVCGDAAPTASSANGLNTVLQFYALRLHHVLYISDSAASCARLREALPSLACVWSSRIKSTKPENGGLCVKLYWGVRFLLQRSAEALHREADYRARPERAAD